MGTSFTRDQLEAKTVRELKNMCVYELDIPGMTKKPKPMVIDAIISKYGAPSASIAPASAPAGVSALEFTGRSAITKPDGAFGSRTTTTLHVSCGASSGNFPVAGRTVRQVGEFLREILNVDRLSTGLVNGAEVDGDYVLKQGDNLEFLKPAGKKG
jgi:hypothetical protein